MQKGSRSPTPNLQFGITLIVEEGLQLEDWRSIADVFAEFEVETMPRGFIERTRVLEPSGELGLRALVQISLVAQVPLAQMIDMIFV